MGFIKNADGDQTNTIEHVFEGVDEVLEEIASHAAPDEPALVVDMSSFESLDKKESN